MSLLNDAAVFFGGICFALAYPAPALYLRGRVIDGAKALKAKFFPAKAQ